MKISFGNSRLKKELEDDKKLFRAFGAEIGKAIQKRLADLDAVDVLQDMKDLGGKCEELTSNRKGQLSVRLSANYRLIFRPCDVPPALKEDGGIDWTRVRSIEILEVIDYH